MRHAQNVAIDPDDTIEAVSVRQLRLWSAPQTIMVATNLADELAILPHAILQARQSSAKILLVHVVDASDRVWAPPAWSLRRTTSRNCAARPILDRMAQQLRWVGITCEPVVLTGIPEVEIPRLAKARAVDRLIMVFEDNPDLTASRNRTLAERLLPAIEVPVCLIGRHVSLSSPRGLKARNITLAVSLDSDCQIHIGFASRLAQEIQAKLSVLHVSSRERRKPQGSAGAVAEVVSRLPFQAWREAELFCPAQINLRKGEPAEEILKHSSSQNESSIVLCSSGVASPVKNWRNSVSYRVLTEARCPVFILERRAPQPNHCVKDEVASLTEQRASAIQDRNVIWLPDRPGPSFKWGRK